MSYKNNSILYISDLDGTLLNSNAEISEYTQNQLNGFIKAGINFSIATARTYATASKMLAAVNINIPIVLMNGVCVYDTQKNTYLKIELIIKASLFNIADLLHKNNMAGFFYSIDNQQLNTFYEGVNSPNAVKFIEEREKKFGKIFTKVKAFEDCFNNNVVYYSVSDLEEKLRPIYEQLRQDSNLHIEFYRDIYNQDYWYMEICSVTASKYNAVNYLREKYNFDKIIGFGDNLNDLPLFKACDESYAMENAKDEVKLKANGIILSNNDNGVVKKIAEILSTL